MEVSLCTAIPASPQFLQFSTAKWKPLKHRAVCCLGLESHDDIEMRQDRLQSMDYASEKSQNDIWQLFREARRNILYLSKQCLIAIEELEEMKRKQKSMLDKIEQLEVKRHAFTKKDLLSISSELLLRIDSMVLTGIIDTGEASGLRNLVPDSKFSIADNFSDIRLIRDAEILAELRQFAEKRKMKGFHILHICTEMEPVISVGSLASYVTCLSHALQRKGNLVEVILPKYASLNLDKVEGLREIEAEFYSYFNGQLHRNRIWTGFTYFSRASLDYILKSGKQPDVLHIHNWETSIVGPLFWDVFVNQGLGATRIVLTCQSFDSQSVEHPDKLVLCGLDPSRLHRPDRLQDNNQAHLVNILKGGVVYSNKVIILSSMHSLGQIIRTLGNGLEPTLATHKDKLLVAPFGFDNSTWDPSRDKYLPQRYSADDMRGKAACKVALQQHLGLPEDASIICVGCIFSEVLNVNLENLKTVAHIAVRRGVQFIFMGISKIPVINRQLESFQEDLKDEKVRFLKKYDEALSHLIFAGSDIILCPFDYPVLQAPLRAIKYGAAPVPVNVSNSRFRHFIDHDFQGTKFSEYFSNTFANVSLSQALDEIKNNPSQWNRKIINAMAKDLSWDAECCDIHVSAYTSIKN